MKTNKTLITVIVILTICLVFVKRKEITSRSTVNYWGNGTIIYTENASYIVTDGYLVEKED